MQYKVSRQYLRDKAKTIAQFTHIEDARLFIESKLSEDARLKMNIIYRIIDMDECLEEYNQDKANKAKIDTGSAGGMSSSSANRPSPFSTTPQPRNTMPKWTSDSDDDK